MNMTQGEFNELCRSFRKGPQDEVEVELFARIHMASMMVIRDREVKRRRLPEETELTFHGDLTEVVGAFLDSCDRRQLRLLKQIADALILNKEPIPPLLRRQ
jgi:hypothetical protein